MADERYPRAAEVDKALTKLIADLHMAVVDLVEFTINLADDDLYGHLAAYKIIYEKDDLVERLSKITTKIKQDLSYKTIPDIMDALKIESIRYQGKNFIRSTAFRASIPENMREKGFAWLKEAGLEGCIKETANANTLASVIADYIEETGIEPPEDAVKIHKQPYIQVRK